MPPYASVFFALSTASLALAIALRGPFWLLMWPAIVFALVALAYVRSAPHWIGKRPDGTYAAWRRIVLMPYFVFSHGLWKVHSWFSNEDAYNEVAPSLWVGRWPGARALPDGVAVVIDVTAELPAHATLTGSKRYLCLPALDAAVPDEHAFAELVDALSSHEGGIFVHCAFGHGRSAMVAAALIIARGLARDAKTAEEHLKLTRPRVSLTGLQRVYVERFAEARRAASR